MTDKDILCFLASEGHWETPDSRFGWNVVGLFDNMPRRRMHLEVWGMNLEEFDAVCVVSLLARAAIFKLCLVHFICPLEWRLVLSINFID